MVIVDPAIQRAGIGRALMHDILDRAGEAPVLLNATKAGETLYRQLGFQDIGAIVQQWDPLESTCRHASLSIL